MIDKRERFVFRQVPLISRSFFRKDSTEEHDFHESFGHYRVKLFFASLDEIWAICMKLLVASHRCRALQNRFLPSCG